MICDSEWLPSLAADSFDSAHDKSSAKQTSPLKTRVRGSSQNVLDQSAWYRSRSGENATGCVESAYKSASGREEFLQTDPLRFDAGDYNLYRYCWNNTVNCTDPMGLEGLVEKLLKLLLKKATQLPFSAPIEIGPEDGRIYVLKKEIPLSYGFVQCTYQAYFQYPSGKRDLEAGSMLVLVQECSCVKEIWIYGVQEYIDQDEKARLSIQDENTKRVLFERSRFYR